MFHFTANLEQCGNWIPDLFSVALSFPLITKFYLSKPENIIKKFLAQLSSCCFEKEVLFLLKMLAS